MSIIKITICIIIIIIIYLNLNFRNELFLNSKQVHIPKIIWIWWEQGWEKSPKITQYTIKSFYKLNPNYKINLVSKTNLNKYLDKKYNWLFKCEGTATRSDIVRMLLLNIYGGIYTDAATFCCINLDKFIKKNNITNLWMFSLGHLKPFPSSSPKRLISSWFIISSKQNYFIKTWCDKYLENIKKNPINHPYFLLHFTFDKLVETNKHFNIFYKNMIKISGYENRISSDLLHLDINTNINEILKKKNLDKAFHPYNILKKINNNKFIILKLRHKNLNKNTFKNKNSIMNYLINYYKI